MAVTVSGPAHDYLRPDWTCGGCPSGTPWPCSPARVEYGERYRDLGLTVVMRNLLDLAAKDLANSGQIFDPSELHDRFMAWTRTGGQR
ncbi:hypothetical protein AB0J86_27230 [Micromonospora sp. NPDC049559]|uniref:hypothetical protein n=1 Tax=Micromonospora sp. NPDC049559 TaxID=3155923 RepID=UPI0034358FAF